MNLLQRLFFTFFYFRDPPWDTGITPPELVDFINTHPAGRALDLGCGTGTNAISLAQHGWQVIGVDFVRRAIRQARRKASLAGVEVDFRVDDVTRLKDIAGHFDLILDIGCFHGLTQNSKAVYASNLDRLLATGGIFLQYAFFRDPGGGISGMREQDLAYINRYLQLIDRQDGFEGSSRPSAWFTYQK